MPITPQQKNSAQDAQFEAAHDSRPQIRLIAGPGTGKSFVIQERVLWLLHNGIAPNGIYVVSFTRASALDLRSRVYQYCDANGVSQGMQVSVTTLHSLALRILRMAGLLSAYPVEPLVVDQWEQQNIYDAEFSTSTDLTPQRCGEIRREHEAFWSTGNWAPPNYLPPNPPINTSERSAFIQFHQPRSQTYACVLPGEIVRKCVDFIKAGTLEPVAKLGIQHLIVDEFQDLNPSDLEFVRELTDRGVSTFVAGDDDQSVYSFRFASPEGIQRFTQQYPNSGDHELSDCFRCTPIPLSVSISLISSNPLPNRIPKKLNSLYRNATPPLTGSAHLWSFPSGAAEARALAESCRDLIATGIEPREILILISDRKILERDIVNAFKTLQVPFDPPTPNGLGNSPEGRLILAILRIICNRNDYLSIRALLGLQQGVGAKTCDNIASAVIQNNLNYGDLFYKPLPLNVFRGRDLAAINKSRNVIERLSSWQEDDVLDAHDTDIQIIIESILGPSARQLWIENTTHLPRLMTLHEIRDYLWADNDEQQVEILRNVYQRLGQDLPTEGIVPQKVRMMTMHGAKGLSAKVVIIPGLEEEIFPGQWRRPYPGLVLEAARLLYVSISRARVGCILSYAKSRIVYGKYTAHTPSRFTVSLGTPFISRQAGGLNSSQTQSIIQECNQL